MSAVRDFPCLSQSVWLEYKVACEEVGIRVASYTLFCQMWKDLLPHITVMRPMTDLCLVCQKNSVSIMRAANLPEEEKSEVFSH